MVRLLVVAVILSAACGSHSSNSPDAAPPDAAPLLPGPTLSARPGQNQTHLTWSAVDGATSYNVYRSNAQGTQGAIVGSVAAMQLDDTSVTNFEPEWYEVTGVVGGVETAPSNQANAFGYDLSHWTVRQEAFRLGAFAYGPANSTATGKDIYVAAGYNGTVLTSSDGVAWTHVAPLPISRVDSVTFGAGQFVAVGYSQTGGAKNVFTSGDGVTWTMHDSGDGGELESVAYAVSGALGSTTSLYIAVGDANTILTSPDGATWTKHTCGMGGFYTVSVLPHVNMLSSSYVSIAAGVNGVCYSTNGTTWTAITLPMALANKAFVASTPDETTSSIWMLDNEGTVYQQPYNFTTSALGTASSTTLPATGTYFGIAASVDATSTRHVVAASRAGILYGTTAATATGFTQLAGAMSSTPLVPPAFEVMGAAGSAMFVLTEGEQILRTTDDGATLAIVRDDPGGTNNSVATHGALTVIDNGNGVNLSSHDAATFSPGTTTSFYESFHIVPTASGVSLAYVDTSALQIFESSDAQTWTQTTAPLTLCPGCSPTPDGWVLPLDGGGYHIAMAEYQNSNTTGLDVKGSAASGFTTSLETPNLLMVQTWQRAGMFYGLTSVGTASVMESGDGVTWTTIAQFPTGFLPTCYFDDGATKYIADAYGKLSTSSDGVTWSAPRVLDPGNRAVSRLLRMGDHLIAVGDSGLFAASLDGLTWTPLPAVVDPDYFSDLALTDRGLVVVGSEDVVLTAP